MLFAQPSSVRASSVCRRAHASWRRALPRSPTGRSLLHAAVQTCGLAPSAHNTHSHTRVRATHSLLDTWPCLTRPHGLLPCRRPLCAEQIRTVSSATRCADLRSLSSGTTKRKGQAQSAASSSARAAKIRGRHHGPPRTKCPLPGKELRHQQRIVLRRCSAHALGIHAPTGATRPRCDWRLYFSRVPGVHSLGYCCYQFNNVRHE